MRQEDIQFILKTRIAVYRAGVKAGFWKDIDNEDASVVMSYIFPKSGQVAYYNLLLESMRTEHAMLTGSVYHLFKLPVQIEKELSDYVKQLQMKAGPESEFIKDLVDNFDEYLASKDTIVTEYAMDVIRVGAFSQDNIDNLIRLCVAHYRHSFETNVKSFPYIS